MFFRERLLRRTDRKYQMRPAANLAVGIFAIIFILMPYNLAWSEDSDCTNKTSDVQIKACTRIIKSKRLLGKKISKKNLAITYGHRGNAYVEKRQYDRAINDYNKAIELNPNDERNYINRGNAYKNKGEVDRALADYDKAIQLNPKDHIAYLNRGEAYGRKGEIQQEIADYDRAIQINPDYAQAYHNRGSSYEVLGQLTKAKEDYRKALKLDTSCKSCRASLNRLKATNANFGDGLKAYKRGDMKSELAEWKPLAKLGHAEAAFRIAEMYEFAEGVPQNNRLSAKYYLMAAKSHNPKAQTKIAIRYQDGRGVKRSWENALFWYFIVRNNKIATFRQRLNAEGTISSFNNMFVLEDRKGAKRAMERAEIRAKAWMSDYKARYSLISPF